MAVAQKLVKLLPSILITMGSLMIANVLWPILSHHFFTSPSLQKRALVLPIPEHQLAYAQPLTQPEPAQPYIEQALGKEPDFTQASTWFTGEQFPQTTSSKITHYTISIPSVDVHNAVVAIGGEDLSESLIQYPGTANPGQLGSPVIFGHSVLRQFYNPDEDNPRRYISIFSKIMTLKKDDEIVVEYDGITYTYTVTEKFEVKPEDVYILQQRYNNRELKLVTCVPEGTYLRRGVVVAQLQEIGQSRTAL